MKDGATVTAAAPAAAPAACGGRETERAPVVNDVVYVLPPLRTPLRNLATLKRCISSRTDSTTNVYLDGSNKADVHYSARSGLRVKIGSIWTSIPFDASGNGTDLPLKIEAAIRRACFKFKVMRVAAVDGDSFSVDKTAGIPKNHRFKLCDIDVSWSFDKPSQEVIEVESDGEADAGVSTEADEGGEQGGDEAATAMAVAVEAAAVDPPNSMPSVGDIVLVLPALETPIRSDTVAFAPKQVGLVSTSHFRVIQPENGLILETELYHFDDENVTWKRVTESTIEAYPSSASASALPAALPPSLAATASRDRELRSGKRSMASGSASDHSTSSALVPEPIGVAAMDKRLDKALSKIDAGAELRVWFQREHANLGASPSDIDATFDLASRYADQKAFVEQRCEAKMETIRTARDNLHATNAAAEQAMSSVRLAYPTLLASASPPSDPIGAQLVNAIAFIDATAILKAWFQAEHEKTQSGGGRAHGVGRALPCEEGNCRQNAQDAFLLRTARDALQRAYDQCDEAIRDDHDGAGSPSPKRARDSRD